MSVTDNVREVADRIRKFNDIEWNRKIVDLEGEILDLIRDKRRLETRVEDLEDTLAFKQKLVFKEPFVWLEGDATPYCPSCWEANHKAVHVVLVYDDEDSTGRDCPNCKHRYIIRKRARQEMSYDSPTSPLTDVR